MAIKDDVETQLLTALNRHDLIPHGGRVLVAVSGGIDSVCLLHALLATKKDGAAFDIVVAHIDHGLRCESAADAQFVRSLCADLNLDCHLLKVDVKALALQRKQGLEEAGRSARRKFLQQVAKDANCDCIALAHHRDDQAETVLLRLTRGCGVSGLAAMRWRDGLFIRPLLGVGREQIVRYIHQCGIDYVEDASNSSLAYARNRVRHQVLPQLGRLNPSVATQLAKISSVVELEESYWQQQVNGVVQRLVTWHNGELRIGCAELLQEHPALYMRVLRYCLEQIRGHLQRIEMVHIDAVAALLHNGRPQRELNLPQAWVARRYDELVFRTVQPTISPVFSMVVDGAGDYPLPDGSLLRIEFTSEREIESADCVEFDAQTVCFPLWLRSVQAGDRMTCAGMTGHKKVKKIFAEHQVELEKRQSALVLGRGHEVLWLLGLRRSGDYVVKSGDSVVLSCKIVPVASTSMLDNLG
ncbi:MAG: tRNA lysidine(34) synthetase TilS [Desulfuromonas sp.]|nr:tRNA lysidine(34) synthetase TilS [Desulfuromonas sp.]